MGGRPVAPISVASTLADMDLTISYNKAGAYALEDIINLISLGGYNCGIGEWRPEKGGQNGMYHVECQ